MAQFVAERLRRSIEEKPIRCTVPDGALVVTTSIGGTLIEQGDNPVKVVLDRADKMLYAAKNQGRNCTVFEKFGKLDPEKFKQEPRAVIE